LITGSGNLGGTCTTGGNVRYDDADTNAGATPAITAIAFATNGTGGNGTNILYAIDTDLATLDTLNQADGTLSTVGAIGIATSANNCFDIINSNSVPGANGAGFAIFNTGGVSNLYGMNLTDGSAFSIGQVGNETNLIGLALLLVPLTTSPPPTSTSPTQTTHSPTSVSTQPVSTTIPTTTIHTSAPQTTQNNGATSFDVFICYLAGMVFAILLAA